MDTDEPQALAQAAAAGDRAALRELLERFLPDVRAFVRLRVGRELRSHESRSDIVQSVCREILQHGSRFQHASESAFRRWLFLTALRKIRNRQRFWTREKRQGTHEPIQADGDLADSYSTFASPSKLAMVREEVEQVESAFDHLSDEHREVITLAHVVGLSRAEIAEQMGRTEEAVRALLHRAMVRLSGVVTSERSAGDGSSASSS